jgi:hypothetical protein
MEYSELRITSWEATLESNKFIADTLRDKIKQMVGIGSNTTKRRSRK